MKQLLFLLLCIGGCQKNDGLPVVGTLERDRLELIAEAQEPIIEISVREGDHVQTGDMLLRLDDMRAQAALDQARAAHQRNKRRLAELVRGPRQEEIIEARARLQGAESELQMRQLEYQRIRALVEDKLASASQLDQERAARDRAKATRDETAAALKALLDGTTIEELDQAHAAVAGSEARVRELQISADRLTVRAPNPGTIDALPFEAGEQPPVGATVVVMLADGQPYGRVYIPAPIRSQVTHGTQANIHVDGVDKDYLGTVRFVSSEAAFTPYFALNERDRSRLTYLAEIDLIEPDAVGLPTGVPITVEFSSRNER
jgi:HlyD family secretion protein